MFLPKRHLSRRTVLKGAGITLALPLLDAMVPAATALAQTAAAPMMRMGFFYIPHGAVMGNTSHGPEMDKWTPGGAGADFTLSPTLGSLEPYKKYVTSFGNLQNQAMVGGVHGFAPATWLSGHRPERGSASASMSTTLDQVVAQQMEFNPRKVFAMLFGEGDTPEERAEIQNQTRSLLDRITGRTRALQRDLGANDRRVLDAYLETVREIERRVNLASS